MCMLFFGRIRPDGDIDVFTEDGQRATRLPRPLGRPYLYPVGSNLSTHYEHAEGIILDQVDAAIFGLQIER